jgi:hypothetical protein
MADPAAQADQAAWAVFPAGAAAVVSVAAAGWAAEESAGEDGVEAAAAGAEAAGDASSNFRGETTAVPCSSGPNNHQC